MTDLLEDPDGAPYPEPVQDLWRQVRDLTHPDDHDALEAEVVDALDRETDTRAGRS